jgi:hypothetical protein
VSEFKKFATAVRNRFIDISKEPLLTVDVDKDTIWDTYLNAFPEGSDPIFRERSTHDCSCCRHFIYSVGNVVAVQNGAMSSIWDLNGIPEPYQTVANAMSAYIKSRQVNGVFCTSTGQYGAETSHGMVDGVIRRFNHFSLTLPNSMLVRKEDVGYKRSFAYTTHAMLVNAVTKLNPVAVDEVLRLIKDNEIYRGQEFLNIVTKFKKLQSRLLPLADNPEELSLLAWAMIDDPAARFKNTVIGTLVEDLSDDSVADADAIRMYESKVAPLNYKRPTALITKSMVTAAAKTIEELGLESALERRHARFSDVSVNDVLFVDAAIRPVMKAGSIESLLERDIKQPVFDKSKAEEILIDEFVASVLPKCSGLQLYLDNSLNGNFVSMTAPVHPESKHLFKWDNDFAWSYDGGVADSIKERVKKAGGRVDNVAMRFSLAWFNTDDLDLHCVTPDKGHIYYASKQNILDVDMNVSNLVRDAVENMRWISKPSNGVYTVYVKNFTKRESVDVGFVVEIEHDGVIDTLIYNKAIQDKGEVTVAKVTVKSGKISDISMGAGITRGSSSRERWGLKTLELVRVNSVVLSPNYWGDNSVGNQHWFFILDGCKNPESVRGIYNEFLHSRLDAHRKVFEVLGDRTKCPVVDEQMSGVGFSSTQHNTVIVVADERGQHRTYSIVF